jgi:hypothetical protein
MLGQSVVVSGWLDPPNSPSCPWPVRLCAMGRCQRTSTVLGGGRGPKRRRLTINIRSLHCVLRRSHAGRAYLGRILRPVDCPIRTTWYSGLERSWNGESAVPGPLVY